MNIVDIMYNKGFENDISELEASSDDIHTKQNEFVEETIHIGAGKGTKINKKKGSARKQNVKRNQGKIERENLKNLHIRFVIELKCDIFFKIFYVLMQLVHLFRKNITLVQRKLGMKMMAMAH